MFLEVENISFSYKTEIIQNVSFSVLQGETIGIVGSSGTGKTTLLKLLGGMLDANTGTILFKGKKIQGPSHNLVPGYREIQLVNQDFGLDIYHTVEENIREKVLHLSREKRDKKVEELLKLVELTHLRNQKAISISGGEQQRLSIARAIAVVPELLLLDEPFVHLDRKLKIKLIHFLRELQIRKKIGIIIVSHDGEELLSVSDRLFYFHKGKLKRKGTPFAMYYQPSGKKEAEFFGPINQLEYKGEKILFRPDEYSLASDEEEAIKVEFQYSSFIGTCFVSHFLTEKKEKIQLYHRDKLDGAKKIIIKKRNSSSFLG